ncbi:unnamed protein product [Linum trigynum]|uniref:KIB1-4 beta-propeller domain-containing protein n=1 Tax=Linum trigynum TaxID=586398 RepID=A0AAV2GGL1_9ROSI
MIFPIMSKSRKRPWADLTPDVLNLIYAKLPPGPAGDIEFRSVCKNWRRIDLESSPASASKFELPPAAMIPRPYTHLTIPDNAPSRSTVNGALVIHSWASGWCLLGHDHRIFGCYNPLFPWPAGFIRLPESELHWVKVIAAFSAPPTGSDWTILLVDGLRSFRTLRRGQRRWREYTYRDNRDRLCQGIGYRDRNFFCLFEDGDVMMFGIGGGKRRRILSALPHPQGRFLRIVVVAELRGGKGSLVVRWADELGRIRLVEVEKRAADRTTAAAEIGRELFQWKGAAAGSVVLATEEKGLIMSRAVHSVLRGVLTVLIAAASWICWLLCCPIDILLWLLCCYIPEVARRILSSD